MKLPTPETWETLVALKGNKASTWEELIEHKKLPFMAMLRNLRNLIFTGIELRYHQWVLNRLQNETSVIQSKQFPFRFFSAYEVRPRLHFFLFFTVGSNSQQSFSTLNKLGLIEISSIIIYLSFEGDSKRFE
jgi:hypothetical protein